MEHRAMQNPNIIMFKLEEQQICHSIVVIALFYISTIIVMMMHLDVDWT